jgi:hypothetical protein
MYVYGYGISRYGGGGVHAGMLVLGTFGIRRSSKTGFNSISGV